MPTWAGSGVAPLESAPDREVRPVAGVGRAGGDGLLRLGVADGTVDLGAVRTPGSSAGPSGIRSCTAVSNGSGNRSYRT